MLKRKIKEKAFLQGYDPVGNCVYSEILSLSDYYDGEHIWDRSDQIKKLRLHSMKGFLFNADAELTQEFESVFNLKTGIYQSGSRRFADGTIHIDHPKP